MLMQFKTRNQKNSYQFDGLDYSSEVKYSLPEKYKVKNVGANLNYQHEFGSLVRRFQNTDKEVSVFTEIRIPRIEVGVKELERFNKFMDFIAKENKIRFGLE